MTEPTDRPRGERGPRPGGPGRPGGRDQRPPRPMDAPPRRLSDADLRSIVVDGNARALDEEARAMARALAAQPPDGRNATAAVLRTIVGDVRRIELTWNSNAGDAAREVVLLKPKLAYLVGRTGGSARILSDIISLITPGFDLVQDDRRTLKNLSAFVDAIAGYFFADSRPQPAGRPTGGA